MTGRDGQSLRKKGALRERGIGGEGGRAGLGERMERSVGAAASGEERGGQEDDVARWGAGAVGWEEAIGLKLKVQRLRT